MQNSALLGLPAGGEAANAMEKRVAICLATILMCAGSALADPAAVVKAHSDAFGKSFNSCDVPAALNLYEDNAVLIWPGEGEVANGKAAIAKVIKSRMLGYREVIPQADQLRFASNRERLHHQCRDVERHNDRPRRQANDRSRANH